ncbi:hypothetical protein CSKR_102638 [Clonorchis sinensis]|uniref:Uncharacterized protein n=1 Tax=Clonorchis sinensis TaxID=79923 RepID=A0A3R7FD83_CLOSI|nr:hypothetical protein CSKR_102638 [Clonorchis sinensis]
MASYSHFKKYTHLQFNLVFTGDSNESLVYDILQLNVLHKGRLMFQLYIFIRQTSHKVVENSLTAHDRFRPSWGSSAQFGFRYNILLTESWGLHLPDEPQEGGNRSWAVEEFSATL